MISRIIVILLTSILVALWITIMVSRSLKNLEKFEMSCNSIKAVQYSTTSVQNDVQPLVFQNSPRNMALKLIFYIMDVSDWKNEKPVTTPDKVRSFIKTSNFNLSDYISTCTRGSLTIDSLNSLVINVPFPKEPKLKNGTIVSMSTCKDNVFNWADFASEFAKSAGIVVEGFHVRIVIMSKNYHEFTDCRWSGLSTSGRWSGPTPESIKAGNTWGHSVMWIGSWDDVSVYAHELGHIFGFGHAGTLVNGKIERTNDVSDPLASWGANDLRCYSAPHIWRAGWSSPDIILTLKDITNIPMEVTIKLQGHDSGPTGVYIGGSDKDYFSLSYRINMDSIYDRPFNYPNHGPFRFLIVHRSYILDGHDTKLIGKFNTGVWTYEGLKIQILSIDLTSVKASLSYSPP